MAAKIIVGGGISGLIAARILKSRGKEFIGLERDAKVGGRGETGHHRLLNEKSIDYLNRWCEAEWSRVDEEPKERKKGDWVRPETTELEQEKFYLSSSFFKPQKPFSEIIHRLSEPVAEHFQLRKTVEKIDSEKKTVTCQDGSEYPYETLIWCTSLSLLRKLWSGNDSELLKSLKKSAATYSGLNIDFTLASSLLPFKNSAVFPFRFKDRKIRAIGIQDPLSQTTQGEEVELHWLLFLDDDISEDREEVAKVVRSFKREFQKEFPELGMTIKHEKITFLSALSGDEPIPLKTLEISPGVIYLGPQAKLKQESEEESNSLNLDRVLMNCQAFESRLESAQSS